MKKEVNVIIKVSIAVVLIIFIITAFALIIKYNELAVKRDELRSQLDNEKLKLEKLLEEVDMDMDEEYIKKIAREELGYRMPDEVIYYNDLNK